MLFSWLVLWELPDSPIPSSHPSTQGIASLSWAVSLNPGEAPGCSAGLHHMGATEDSPVFGSVTSGIRPQVQLKLLHLGLPQAHAY